MLAFKTLSFLYIRYIAIILTALAGFMVGFDLMDSGTRLPAGANLVMLYIMYKTFFAIDMMLPITLVFAMIAAMVELIRSNALAAYYAIGYSKFRLMSPFLATASVLVVLHIALHATSFARAHEYAENLGQSSQLIRPTGDLFFTHEGNYIYFGNLYPLSKKAEDIRIFNFNDNRLHEIVRADEAVYDREHWNIANATTIVPPENLLDRKNGVIEKESPNIQALRHFKPKILDQVYEGKDNFTIGDGLEALKLLKNQNVDVTKIKSVLYRIFIFPWFALVMMVILYTYVPVSSRFVNLSFFSFGAILATLLVWGVLFVFGELANTKTLSPETGVISPIAALFGVMIWRLGNPLRRVRVKSRENYALKG
ncbi:MAG: LptF/LptG family permease [Sulfuricurvum sp.]